ncbi:ABC-type sulfate transport system permease component [Bradyrhizobium sp. AZCC 1577]
MAPLAGHHFLMSHRSFVWLCLLPLAVVTAAFFLLPMARLVVTGAAGPQGLAGYLAILTEPRYRATLLNTVLLATATTIVTLIVATVAGMFLQRHRFPGRAILIAMLTFPLAFPGVVVGFMIILLAGRQGLIGDFSNRVLGEKLVFAYSIYGLFLGYLYFSIPRVILTIMAAVQKLDTGLEEAARSLGASPWAVQRDVVLPGPGAGLRRLRRNRVCDRDGGVRNGIYAGDQHRCTADADLYRIHAGCEFLDLGRAVGRAWRHYLAYSCACPLLQWKCRCGGWMRPCVIA